MPIFGDAPNNIYKKAAVIKRRSGAIIEGRANKQKGGQEILHTYRGTAMLNNSMIKRKNLLVIVLAFMLFVLVIVGFGCGTRTTVQLDNIPATILNDSLAITNNTQWAWTNVQLTESYTYSMKEIIPQQTVNIVAKDSIYNGQY